VVQVNNRVLVPIVVAGIVLAAIMLAFIPRTLVVPDNYAKIQDAIDNARSGDTVYVRKGIYREALAIEKTLSLLGENSRDTIIINPHERYAPPTIRVSADKVTISGFTILGGRRQSVGINLETYGAIPQPSACRIIGNNILNHTVGISTYGGSNLLISENNVTENSQYGIYHCSSNSVISRNNVEENGWAGIIVDGCSDLTMKGNNIAGNGVDETGPSEDRGGVLLRWTGPFYVYGNIIAYNDRYGISFGEGCSGSRVYGNNIMGNGIGVDLLNFVIGEGVDKIGSGNVVWQNNFVDNLQQALVEREYTYAGNFEDHEWGTNGTDIVSWDDGKEGNFWSDYAGNDTDRDGIGDTPYIIDEVRRDNYPLMFPFDIENNNMVLPSDETETLTIPILVAKIVLAAVAVAAGLALLLRLKKRKR